MELTKMSRSSVTILVTLSAFALLLVNLSSRRLPGLRSFVQTGYPHVSAATGRDAQQALATQSHFTPLASGWDTEVGLKLFVEEKERLAKAVTSHPEKIYTHEVLPLAPVRSAQPWFLQKGMTGKGVPNWEYATFLNFFQHLAGRRY